MKTARQVVVETIHDWLTWSDIEQIAGLINPPLPADRILPASARKEIEDELGIKEWGKWAYLGKEGPGQRIKPVLPYTARVREDLTVWQTIVPMDDDRAMALSAAMAHTLTTLEVRCINYAYVDAISEESAAERLRINRHAFREARDTALKALYESARTSPSR